MYARCDYCSDQCCHSANLEAGGTIHVGNFAGSWSGWEDAMWQIIWISSNVSKVAPAQTIQNTKLRGLEIEMFSLQWQANNPGAFCDSYKAIVGCKGGSVCRGSYSPCWIRRLHRIHLRGQGMSHDVSLSAFISQHVLQTCILHRFPFCKLYICNIYISCTTNLPP